MYLYHCIKGTGTNLDDYWLIQPEKARSAQETLTEVERQVKAACLGIAQTVKDLQTKSGIKDGFTQHWIDELIERSRTMQKHQPQRAVAEIQDELMVWISDNKAAVYNPFLTLIGRVYLFINHYSIFIPYHRLWCLCRHASWDSTHHSARHSEVCLVSITFNMEGHTQEALFRATTSHEHIWLVNSHDSSKLHHAVCKLSNRTATQDACIRKTTLLLM